jgi:hypothetical protein
MFDVHFVNLAKQDDGLAESPTVMVVETRNKNKITKMGENRGVLKPSWAFIETKVIPSTTTPI